MGQLAILQPNRLIFGVNLFTSLRKSFAFLSFDISIGVGIILFTVLIRTVLLPVFQVQMVASRKMQEAQPRIKALREQYPGRDMESRTKLEQEMRKVFKEMGVRQSDSLLADFDSDARLSWPCSKLYQELTF